MLWKRKRYANKKYTEELRYALSIISFTNKNDAVCFKVDIYQNKPFFLLPQE